jgi:hypothetical protein
MHFFIKNVGSKIPSIGIGCEKHKAGTVRLLFEGNENKEFTSRCSITIHKRLFSVTCRVLNRCYWKKNLNRCAGGKTGVHLRKKVARLLQYISIYS